MHGQQLQLHTQTRFPSTIIMIQCTCMRAPRESLDTCAPRESLNTCLVWGRYSTSCIYGAIGSLSASEAALTPGSSAGVKSIMWREGYPRSDHRIENSGRCPSYTSNCTSSHSESHLQVDGVCQRSTMGWEKPPGNLKVRFHLPLGDIRADGRKTCMKHAGRQPSNKTK